MPAEWQRKATFALAVFPDALTNKSIAERNEAKGARGTSSLELATFVEDERSGRPEVEMRPTEGEAVVSGGW